MRSTGSYFLLISTAALYGGCLAIAGITEDYELVEGTGGSTSSGPSSSSGSSSGGGMSTSSGSSSGGGMSTSSSGGGMTSSTSSSGGGGSGGGMICQPFSTMSCYTGPVGTGDIGICKSGVATCNEQGTGYDACVGDVLPQPEDCLTQEDDDCDGVAPPCSGGPLWAKRFGDASSQVAKSIAVHADGTSLITGYIYGSADFGNGPLTSAGASDAFLAKIDPSGSTLWSKVFGDGGLQEGRSVAIDTTDAVVMTGAFSGTMSFGGGTLTSAGSNDIFVAKLDAQGNHVWSKNFGNNSNQYGNGVAITASNDVVITGYMGGTVDFGGGLLTSTGGTDVFVAKFDSNGAYMWGNLFGNVANQLAYGVAAQPSGNVVVVGNFGGIIDFGLGSMTTSGMNDIFLVSFDAAGIPLWSKRFGDGSEQFAYAVAVEPNSGNIAVTGSFSGSVDFGGGMLASAGGHDVYIAVFSSTGAHLWSKGFGSAMDQIGYGVIFDASGDVAIVGAFAGDLNFTGESLVSAGANDAFIAKFSGGGSPLWSRQAGDVSDQVAFGVGADGSKNALVTGSFMGVIDWGLGATPSLGAEDIFLVKFVP